MRFSIGIDDFKAIRTTGAPNGEPWFYVDKTLLIEDILNDGAGVIVLPRPKRFGKTLNLSMLKYFFDIEHPENAALFQGLKIADNKNIMKNWQGKYPVVFISFKSLTADNYDLFLIKLKKAICECHRNYTYLLDSEKLDDTLKNKIKSYHHEAFPTQDIEESLFCLTQALSLHHGQNAIVLMDEYDTPLQTAYLADYFEKAIQPFRDMMGKTFKGNIFLYKGVITGITRIAKESLFSGVNNLKVYDITTNRYASYFGFTEEEISTICDSAHLEDLKSWYNGYMFGDNLTIYNPWSILNFLSSDYKFAPYWINTSSNDLIKETLTADKMENVKNLIEGRSIAVEIEPFTVMDNLKGNNTAFWNLLFLSGYLTLNTDKKMRIPNKEIQYFFEKVVISWFGNGGGIEFLGKLLGDFIGGRIIDLQTKLQKLLLETMSFHDVGEGTQEAFYHGFLLGITLGLKGRYIRPLA